MHDMEAPETAEPEGLFDRALGFAGTAAHVLHHPIEHLAEGAAEHVEQLEHLIGLPQALPEAVQGLRAPLDPGMAEPWIEGLKESGRAGQVPTGPFFPSLQQVEEITVANAKGADEAAEAFVPAVNKATTLGRVSKALPWVVAAESAHEEYKDSSAQTMPGKLVDAGLAGATNFAMTKTPLGLVDAGMGLLGSGLSWGGEKLGVGGMQDAGGWLKHNKPGHSLAAGLGGAVTAAEGLITGDSTGMEKWNQESLQGKHGMILQGYSQIGNAMASSKAMDKLFDWICD
jgi:hypothetical protein